MTNSFEADETAADEPHGGNISSVAEKLRTHSSSLIAKTLEYRLLGDISAELLLRGQAIEVLRSDIDAFGHDVVLEVGGIVRHIQLKLKVKGGKNLEVTCHTDLTLKPSGCIIWTTYDPLTYSAVEYACLGGRPGEALRDIGNVVAKRSTHNGQGDRPVRTRHRSVKYSTFEKFTDMADLVDWLFGGPALPDGRIPDPAVITSPDGKAMLISTGSFSVLPMSLNLTDGTALVQIVPGPGSVEDLMAAGGKEPSGTWCSIDLTTGTWDLGDGEMASDPAVTAVMRAATTQLQTQMAATDAEGPR